MAYTFREWLEVFVRAQGRSSRGASSIHSSMHPFKKRRKDRGRQSEFTHPAQCGGLEVVFGCLE